MCKIALDTAVRKFEKIRLPVTGIGNLFRFAPGFAVVGTSREHKSSSKALRIAPVLTERTDSKDFSALQDNCIHIDVAYHILFAIETMINKVRLIHHYRFGPGLQVITCAIPYART